ncbi:ribosome assembly factor SBDS [Candidatus Pacearchaeota archaeon CG10_big_fil_rev_8_21_14_0_10_35_219]|nr:ribosome assembly factor SBDS [Candidatus Pacearchaeota archaeon]OIO43407.1 MAG: hypothetical protein AUJ63_00770 [Candidatus Pacearchaeota archaeon CG1_02_35_32]PIO08052.1 MAG: ribosome assembly factor SBDS [Candidatus Pacearchaeota archaeon CG10_big_fil_rev_8_21_14_0_10_35_219]PIY81564.1 MAG: ribosome assembly factor SBDS [Candidatus Pacearchaeota archaeon CG_4_10_14_0_8_um_filter_35_169]PIZ78939.1 MAG: ribosome assembly factor SBDS [Candidatus Pacearchaeota archaeon CG_4_10_14_0_2_um_filt
MAIVEAKKRIGSKVYEVSVEFDEAMKVKKGEGDIASALNSPNVFYDAKKGLKASNEDLKDDFGTDDVYEVAKKIIKEGELQKPQEFRDAEREKRVKQVVDLILRNAVDQHGKPYTEDRIRRAIDEVHYSFDNRPAEQQMKEVVEKLKVIIPISLQIKRLKLTIPAQYTGQVYGVLQDYKEKEDWKNNGDLEVVISIPAGMQLDFFDKLNNVTHGAVQSEELAS